MKNYKFNLNIEIIIKEPEEPTPAPIEHVADAVETLLEDNAQEWLLEAIGHPHPGEFEICVKGVELKNGELI